MLRKLVAIIVIATVVIAGGTYAAFKLSPWPSVLLIRNGFGNMDEEVVTSVAPFVPKGISAQHGLNYAPGERDTLFDIFAPESAKESLPAVIWVHGGGFVAGSRSGLDGYLRMLAGRGYVTAALDYTRAPEAKFPTPVRQTNLALAHILANAKRFNIDPARIFLAGDSAGAQIAAQTALVLSDQNYARQLGIAPGMKRSALRGVVLFCGGFDPAMVNWAGPYGDFMRVVIWSYFGTRDPDDPRVAQMAVTPHVTATYPRAFISAGNADPLVPQSVALADALRRRGVKVDTLLFPKDYKPPLPHEYQLLFSTKEAHLAFDRMVAFLAAHAK